MAAFVRTISPNNGCLSYVATLKCVLSFSVCHICILHFLSSTVYKLMLLLMPIIPVAFLLLVQLFREVRIMKYLDHPNIG